MSRRLLERRFVRFLDTYVDPAVLSLTTYTLIEMPHRVYLGDRQTEKYQ